MRTKFAALALLLASLAAGCGGGNDSNGAAPDEPGATSSGADQASSDATPDVERAAKGEVNRPKEGTYVYAYRTEQTNAAVPDSTPRRSKADSQLTSTVSNKGDVTTTKDTSSEGPAVFTQRTRWDNDGVVDLSATLDSPQSSAGCEYDPPLQSIRLPLKKATLPLQKLAGKGASCIGERTITVEKEESVKDARGVSWPTWRIKIETVVTQPGLTKNNTDTRWFSPDLGKDVRIEGLAEYRNSDDELTISAESSSVLKSYPRT